jgi:hypothetical protein
MSIPPSLTPAPCVIFYQEEDLQPQKPWSAKDPYLFSLNQLFDTFLHCAEDPRVAHIALGIVLGFFTYHLFRIFFSPPESQRIKMSGPSVPGMFAGNGLTSFQNQHTDPNTPGNPAAGLTGAVSGLGNSVGGLTNASGGLGNTVGGVTNAPGGLGNSVGGLGSTVGGTTGGLGGLTDSLSLGTVIPGSEGE